jgi:hypothetical protein
MPTTTITATATVKVRGASSPGAAAQIASILGNSLASSMQAASQDRPASTRASVTPITEQRPRLGR